MGTLIDADALVRAEAGSVRLGDLLGASEPVAITAPTAAELLETVERTSDPALAAHRASFVERLLDRVDVVPFDGPAARMRARLDAARPHGADGRALDVAAIAISRGWAIVTGNGRYDRIPGLAVRKIDVGTGDGTSVGTTA
ncbi:MAG TPA: PIN domain-containing protein [Actinomycetota bacterium]